MNYSVRYQELNSTFKFGVDTVLEHSKVQVKYFSFNSNNIFNSKINAANNVFSDEVSENLSFIYPVFSPCNQTKTDKAILLMHGLNERNWNKYLTWAEYLCNATGKAVILFPIAFHINRSPSAWSNPRVIKSIFDSRQKQYADRSLSLANVALSVRITQNPHRFYSSGRQSMNDLTQLMEEIKSGKHPLFAENTQVDVFAYSIGAFLSQITFMTNPKGLFSDAKLFMFCGGGIFSSMFGESRTIMDKKAFASLLHYYNEEFSASNEFDLNKDKAFDSFYSMIAPERNETERKGFFEKMGKRIAGISMKKDIVIPYTGVEYALGTSLTHKRILLNDYDFEYSHENPFPVNVKTDPNSVDAAFSTILDQGAQFLA